MKAIFSSLFLSAAIFVFAGCEGPVGPPGPGNAEIISFPLSFLMADAQVNGNVASVQYEVPAITRTVVDEGAVLVYFREQNTWTALPYTYAYDDPELGATSFTVSLGYAYEHRYMEVFYELSTDEVSPLDEPDRELKVVVINALPAGKASIDLKDYEAVKAYYGLED